MKALCMAFLAVLMVGSLPASASSAAPAREGFGGGARVGSWITPGAAKGPLLYISDSGAEKVTVYSYPGGTLVGTLDVAFPRGECVDASGNVYITEQSGRVVEYAHGGTRPLTTLKLRSGLASVACSIDPATGNIAIANLFFGISQNPSPGDVIVFSGAHSKASKFRAANLYSYYFLGYDGAGNLFVDGSSGRPGVNVRFEFAELPSGDTMLNPLTLTGGTVASPGNVQWDGTHMTVGDPQNAVIYQLAGSQIVGSTPLVGSSSVAGYFIDGATVICPDAGNGTVEFFNYPAGGTPTKTLTGFQTPDGAVVSAP